MHDTETAEMCTIAFLYTERVEGLGVARRLSANGGRKCSEVTGRGIDRVNDPVTDCSDRSTSATRIGSQPCRAAR